MIRVNLEPCFVLHTRPYRNTSLIVDLLSRQYGRVTAIARSARGPKSRYKGCLQLFVPLLVSWSGRGDLMQLGVVELQSMPYQLTGCALMSGFYLNELLMRFIGCYDECALIFEHYQATLARMVIPYSDSISIKFQETKMGEMSLQQSQNIKGDGYKTHVNKVEQSLRSFEKILLARLGYGLTLDRDYQDSPIEGHAWYQFIPEQGFHHQCDADLNNKNKANHFFRGDSLLAFHQDKLDDSQALRDAKRLMRKAISYYLKNKPLKSRELMIRIPVQF